MSINMETMNITQGAHGSLMKILSFLLSFLVKSFEKEIQPSGYCVDIARGWALE